MLEIEIYVGKDDDGKGLDPSNPKSAIFVQSSPAAMHTGDEVIWHIHSIDGKADSIEIEFKPETDHPTDFFESRGGNRSRKITVPIHGGHGHVFGSAPEVKKHGTFLNKYTVTAFAPKGNPALGDDYRLDPTIVTCEP